MKSFWLGIKFGVVWTGLVIAASSCGKDPNRLQRACSVHDVPSGSYVICSDGHETFVPKPEPSPVPCNCNHCPRKNH